MRKMSRTSVSLVAALAAASLIVPAGIASAAPKQAAKQVQSQGGQSQGKTKSAAGKSKAEANKQAARDKAAAAKAKGQAKAAAAKARAKARAEAEAQQAAGMSADEFLAAIGEQAAVALKRPGTSTLSVEGYPSVTLRSDGTRGQISVMGLSVYFDWAKDEIRIPLSIASMIGIKSAKLTQLASEKQANYLSVTGVLSKGDKALAELPKYINAQSLTDLASTTEDGVTYWTANAVEPFKKSKVALKFKVDENGQIVGLDVKNENIPNVRLSYRQGNPSISSVPFDANALTMADLDTVLPGVQAKFQELLDSMPF